MAKFLGRKLLIVKRDPPQQGWNVMCEFGTGSQTRTFQIENHLGEELLSECLDVVMHFIVQKGLVHINGGFRNESKSK